MKKSNMAIYAIALFGTGIGSWFVFGSNAPHDQDMKPIVSISVPELPQSLSIGKEAFDSNCSSCHGINAVGVDGLGPPLVHIIYEPNHHSDGSFVLAVKKGVRSHHWPFGNMPAVVSVKESEITEIVEYVRFLQRANGIGGS